MGNACTQPELVTVPVYRIIYTEERCHDYAFVTWLFTKQKEYGFGDNVLQYIMVAFFNGAVSLSESEWDVWFQERMDLRMKLELQEIEIRHERDMKYAQKADKLKKITADLRKEQRELALKYCTLEEREEILRQEQRKLHYEAKKAEQVRTVVRPVRWIEGDARFAGNVVVNRTYMTDAQYRDYIKRRLRNEETHETVITKEVKVTKKKTLDSQAMKRSEELLKQLDELSDELEQDVYQRDTAVTKTELKLMMKRNRQVQLKLAKGNIITEKDTVDPDKLFIARLLEKGFFKTSMSSVGKKMRKKLLEEHKLKYAAMEKNKLHQSTYEAIIKIVKGLGKEMEQTVAQGQMGEDELVAHLKLYRHRQQVAAQQEFNRRLLVQKEKVRQDDRDFLDNLESDVLLDKAELAKLVKENLHKVRTGGETSAMQHEMDQLEQKAEKEILQAEGDLTNQRVHQIVGNCRKYQHKLLNHEADNMMRVGDAVKGDKDKQSGQNDYVSFADNIVTSDLQDVHKLAKLLKEKFMEAETLRVDDAAAKKRVEELASDLEKQILRQGEAMTKEAALAALLKYKDHLEGPQTQQTQEDNTLIDNIPEEKLSDPVYVADLLKQQLDKLDTQVEEVLRPKQEETEVVKQPVHIETKDPNAVSGLKGLQDDPTYKNKLEEIYRKFEKQVDGQSNKMTKEELVDLLAKQREQIQALVEEKRKIDEEAARKLEEAKQEEKLKRYLERKKRGSISEEEFLELMKNHMDDMNKIKEHKGQEKDRLDRKLERMLGDRKKKVVQEDSDEEDELSGLEELDDSGEMQLKKQAKKFGREIQKKVEEGVSDEEIQALIQKHRETKEKLKKEQQQTQQRRKEELEQKIQEKMVEQDAVFEKDLQKKQTEGVSEEEIQKMMAGHRADQEILQQQLRQDEAKRKEKLRKLLDEKKRQVQEKRNRPPAPIQIDENMVQALLQSFIHHRDNLRQAKTVDRHKHDQRVTKLIREKTIQGMKHTKVHPFDDMNPKSNAELQTENTEPGPSRILK